LITVSEASLLPFLVDSLQSPVIPNPGWQFHGQQFTTPGKPFETEIS